MTRMPLVCMSIVASAFQYGWAPTLMPVTTTLTSPPSWVNSMMPAQHAGDPVHGLGAGVHRDLRAGRHARTTPPGPEAAGRASIAASTRRHSARPDRAERLGRVAQQHDPASCPPGSRCVGVVTTPSTMFAVLSPGARSTGTGAPGRVEVVLGERARAPVAVGGAGDHRDRARRGRPRRAGGPGSPSGCRRRARRSGCGRRVGDPQRQPGARRPGHPQHQLARRGVRIAEVGRRNCTSTCSSPSAAVRGASERTTGSSSVSGTSTTRPDVELDPVPVQLGRVAVGRAGRAQAVQARVEHALDLRQGPDPAVVVAQDGQVADVGERDEPLVVGHLAALRAEQVHVGGRRQPGQLEVRTAATGRAARRPSGAAAQVRSSVASPRVRRGP